MSLEGALQQLQQLGWSPGTIIDVGAAYGAFTSTCRTFFPEAKYLLCEPLEEYAPFLQRFMTERHDVEYVPAAISSFSGETTIHVHPDFVGSSLYLEGEDSDVNGIPRTVRTLTLTDLFAEKPYHSPFLLKIDVQGAELHVLTGAESLLAQIDVVILEVSLFEFFKGGPQFYDVLAFMKDHGFVPYDLFGLQYRPLDHALSQCDFVFVQEVSEFRKHHIYATSCQRQQQNEAFRSVLTEQASASP